jgi:hypothetical protein
MVPAAPVRVLAAWTTSTTVSTTLSIFVRGNDIGGSFHAVKVHNIYNIYIAIFTLLLVFVLCCFVKKDDH